MMRHGRNLPSSGGRGSHYYYYVAFDNVTRGSRSAALTSVGRLPVTSMHRARCLDAAGPPAADARPPRALNAAP